MTQSVFIRRTVAIIVLTVCITSWLALGATFIVEAPRMARIIAAFTALMGSMIIFTCVMSYATVVSVMVMDELQQRIHLVAIAISGGLTGLAYSLTGVANAIAETPALPAFFAMPMMCILYAIGSATISARYR